MGRPALRWMVFFVAFVPATLLQVGLAPDAIHAQDRPTLFGPTLAMSGGSGVALWWGARLEVPIGARGGAGFWGQIAKPTQAPLLEASAGVIVPEAHRGRSSPYVVVGLSTLSVFDTGGGTGTGVAVVGATFGVGLRLWFGGSTSLSAGIRRSSLLEDWTTLECALTVAGR